MACVSVAMAVYNGEKYLRSQLDSIIMQLGTEDELVISYDESKDGTLQIINEYEGKYDNVKVVMDPGKGVFSNFENAIANCNGDYIFISDQDDIWLPDKIGHVKDVFGYTGADMVIHNGVHIDSEGKVISNDFFSDFDIKKNKLVNFLRPRYSGCCTAFNRKMKDLILPFPRDVGGYDHWIGMVGEIFGDIVFDDTILIQHRLHGSNVTVQRRKLPEILKSRAGILKALAGRRKRAR